MAYFGLISPGMLNMTALKIRINNGTSDSLKFAFGAALVVFIQVGIALYFANFFNRNPHIINVLKVINWGWLKLRKIKRDDFEKQKLYFRSGY